MNKKLLIFVLLSFALLNISCTAYQTIMNLSRLKFKLGNVTNLNLLGINIENKTSISDFSAFDMLKITSAFAKKEMPVSFNLNIDAQNPNDGTGGYPGTNAVIKSFPWRLMIDNKETVSGNISSPVTVPGKGGNTEFGIQINLDLYKFFSDKGYQSIINLVMDLGGYKGSSSKLQLYAQPTVSTSLGDITYPNEIKIVDVSYSH